MPSQPDERTRPSPYVSPASRVAGTAWDWLAGLPTWSIGLLIWVLAGAAEAEALPETVLGVLAVVTLVALFAHWGQVGEILSVVFGAGLVFHKLLGLDGLPAWLSGTAVTVAVLALEGRRVERSEPGASRTGPARAADGGPD